MGRNDDTFAEYYRDQALMFGEGIVMADDEGPSMGEYEEDCARADEAQAEGMVKAMKNATEDLDWLRRKLADEPDLMNRAILVDRIAEVEAVQREIAQLQRDMVWTTRDKRKVKVGDMTDSHLVNTVRWLRRNEAAILTLALMRGCPPEDMPTPSDLVEIFEVAQGIVRGSFLNDLPICVAMMEEAWRRGLEMCLWTP